MTSPYVGEIRLFAGTFAPVNWHLCDGTLLPISENEVLYNLIGTTYGGDGQSTFGLPDLRSRVPVHQGSYQGATYVMGQIGGVESVSISDAQMPTHSHPLLATTGGQTTSPLNAIPTSTASTQDGTLLYGTGAASLTSLVPTTILQSGSGLGHSNIQPFVALTFIISLYGIYPSQG